MKKYFFTGSAILSIILFMGCDKKTDKKAELKTKMDSVSYVIGTNIGRNLKADTSIKFNTEAISAGINDAINGKDSLIFKEVDKQKILMAFQQEMMQKEQEKAMKASEPNKRRGVEFLAENKKKAGVIETKSGLQYKVIKQGKGKKPTEADQVTVNYEGQLIDGTVFDSSYKRGEPATFGLNGVIRGWIEGLQLMNIGSVYELYIPSDLAYGDTGNQVIPGGSTLIFKVELLKIEAPKAQENTTK
ncbi:MAG: FKBP-type peptidyl-prolyl cis-trans isomerase [Bacteroidales bacterium]|nr:FKBP-type peptidyl-prolyl cis-trans isomerase [Bacteroidales bacterium]